MPDEPYRTNNAPSPEHEHPAAPRTSWEMLDDEEPKVG